MNISYYPIIYIYIYIYIYIHIYICMDFVFCLLQQCLTNTHDGHTGFTFKSSFPAGYTWSLSLAETACPIVNKIQVINKEARAT